MSEPRGDSAGMGVGGAPLASPPAALQLLFGLKSPDPTALTAAEAIRHLLGFGDRLVALHRRQLVELVLAPSAPVPEILRYLDRTMVLWNSNKQRGWLRADGLEFPGAESGAEGYELQSGGTLRAGGFGAPRLTAPAYQHLLVWSRGEEATPADLPSALRPYLLACGRGELFTLQWGGGSSPEERCAWTDAVAEARSRTQGLLVNRHYQDVRRFDGPVPLPLWGA